MKTFALIAKIVIALAAIAGLIYVAATYGDKIVAWAKNLVNTCKCRFGKSEVIFADAGDAPIASDVDFEG